MKELHWLIPLTNFGMVADNRLAVSAFEVTTLSLLLDAGGRELNAEATDDLVGSTARFKELSLTNGEAIGGFGCD